MKYGVSVTDTSKVKKIEKSGLQLLEKLVQFSKALNEVASFQSPRGIIFHDLASATQLYSTLPLPAYTSRDLIHITPLVETWKDIYISTTNGVEVAKTYYTTLDMEDVAVIAAHELTHHVDFFHSDFEELDEENMWFEEGLCFYIPRKFILSEEKFNSIMNVESCLINKFKEKYGEYTLNLFGESAGHSEELEYSSAFYDYWRSTAVVDLLIRNYCNGSVQTLIDIYKEWAGSSKESNLQTYFVDKLHISNEDAKNLWLAY
ncbi:hypothetical protein CN378_04905 [Bacillus sp. AFS015802]|uniref:hypothetical protein n=1 Tax=Bacillus sp. AFS015802 TaxID=2033486 RepID=UPI000BF316F7|nr:hypothetical protein [Bacillus sp. AFS015802]PFA69216.1 hypothetical protein CN378_04905 [Bacillus sp. AFS015802]